MADEDRPTLNPTPQVSNGDEDDGSYNPSKLEATLSRQQGLGVGARDVERQRDPTPGDDRVPSATEREAEDASKPAPAEEGRDGEGV